LDLTWVLSVECWVLDFSLRACVVSRVPLL
jgi:hypothetical protein